MEQYCLDPFAAVCGLLSCRAVSPLFQSKWALKMSTMFCSMFRPTKHIKRVLQLPCVDLTAMVCGKSSAGQDMIQQQSHPQHCRGDANFPMRRGNRHAMHVSGQSVGVATRRDHACRCAAHCESMVWARQGPFSKDTASGRLLGSWLDTHRVRAATTCRGGRNLWLLRTYRNLSNLIAKSGPCLPAEPSTHIHRVYAAGAHSKSAASSTSPKFRTHTGLAGQFQPKQQHTYRGSAQPALTKGLVG